MVGLLASSFQKTAPIMHASLQKTAADALVGVEDHAAVLANREGVFGADLGAGRVGQARQVTTVKPAGRRRRISLRDSSSPARASPCTLEQANMQHWHPRSGRVDDVQAH